MPLAANLGKCDCCCNGGTEYGGLKGISLSVNSKVVIEGKS